MTNTTPEVEAVARAMPLIKAIASWETEHGTLAGIMPHEYEGFMCSLIRAAVFGSARAAIATLAKPEAPEDDTVAFVQEWMMSGDHEADQWHRDFAAAIDARLANSARVETMSQALEAAALYLEEAGIGQGIAHLCRATLARKEQP